MCNLLIYQNDALRWASKVAFVPVAISRAHFAAISGALVLLSDEGSLAVGYLGTNPSLKVIPMPSSSGAFGNGTGEESSASSASSSSSSEKMAEDLKELKKIVAAYHLEGNGSNGGKSAESEANNRISLYLDLLLTGLEQPPADTSSSLFLAVNLELSSMAPLATGPLTVHFLPGDFYEISPAEPITVASLEKGKPEPIRLLLKSRVPLPLSPKLKAAVLLHNEEGAVRVLRKTVRLPLEGLVQVHGGGKGGKGGHGKGSGGAPSRRRFSVKVIFEGRSLEEVRSAVFGPAGGGGGLLAGSESSETLLVGGGSSSAPPPQSEVSLHYRSNPSMEATIRVAAAAGGDEGRGGGGGVALQVEGNQVAALYRTLRELRRRVLRSSPAAAPPLTSPSSSSSTSTPTQSPTPVGSPPPPPPPQLAPPYSSSSSSAVTVHSLLATLQPVDALAAKIEQRLVLRKALAACQSALDRFSTHYRVLQKRILVKLKDRQPSSLAHFEKLLKTVHAKINDLIEQIGRGQAALAALNYQIWAHLKLLKVLLKLQLGSARSAATATAGNRRLQTILKLLAVQQMTDFTKNWEEQLEANLLSTLQLDRDIAHLAVVLDYEAANSMASGQSLQTVLRAAYQAFAEQTGVTIQVV
ncbi:Protein PTHB1 [Tyrophagus putrescentiae]|nr:Protein PTHB1 [Tyrophagus putrescentiae]